MNSNSRREQILDVLVRDYIKNNEAMSSAMLVEKAKLNVSSATIRNDLVALEKEGYVTNLHTSSGRIPTDKGYRYFVDHLMPHKDLLAEEKDFIDTSVSKISSSIDRILEHTALVLSQMSQYPVIIVTENKCRNILKFIQLVLLNVHQILVIILNNYGENVEEIIQTDSLNITQEELNKISQMLNNVFSDCSMDDVEEIFIKKIDTVHSKFSAYETILEKIRTVLINSDKVLSERKIVVNNNAQLLSYPEFRQIEVLERINKVLNDEHQLVKMFCNVCLSKSPAKDIQAQIGHEHVIDDLVDTSLICGKLEVNDNKIADIGVLGPTRMRYQEIFERMSYMLKRVSNKISRIF